MERIQYSIGKADGQWFVEVHDQLYGPYGSEALATRDVMRAVRRAHRQRHFLRDGVTWFRTKIEKVKRFID